jgi:tetratricopeptide (TPR) repeat protein
VRRIPISLLSFLLFVFFVPAPVSAESAGQSYYRAARKAYQAGKSEEALSLYGLALQVGRDDYRLWYGIAQAHFAAGRLAPALSSLGEAFARESRHSEAYVLRARIRQRQMRYPDAENDYAAALALNPADTFACSQYAWLLEQSARREQAYPYRVRAAELSPRDARTLLAAAKAALALEKLGDAEVWCARAVRVSPSAPGVEEFERELALAQADAARRSGEVQDAEARLHAILERWPAGEHAEKVRLRLEALARLAK